MSADVVIRSLTVRYRDRVAVDDVSLNIAAGTTLGLVGESGSGKTSVARAVAGMLRPASGDVLIGGVSIAGRGRVQRRDVQMVFQDPSSSLNPMMTVRQTLVEALRVAGGLSRSAAGLRAAELLELVRLDPGVVLDRVSGELSGGQRQRVAIARAIAAAPRVLVADEPTSALDVSVQAAVLELLASLRRELDLTVLFISHDLGVVNAVADEVAVMKDGRIVEHATRAEFFANPRTAYARELLAAVPRLPAGPPAAPGRAPAHPHPLLPKAPIVADDSATLGGFGND